MSKSWNGLSYIEVCQFGNAFDLVIEWVVAWRVLMLIHVSGEAIVGWRSDRSCMRESTCTSFLDSDEWRP
jgi:hypothetical protein